MNIEIQRFRDLGFQGMSNLLIKGFGDSETQGQNTLAFGDLEIFGGLEDLGIWKFREKRFGDLEIYRFEAEEILGLRELES